MEEVSERWFITEEDVITETHFHDLVQLELDASSARTLAEARAVLRCHDQHLPDTESGPWAPSESGLYFFRR